MIITNRKASRVICNLIKEKLYLMNELNYKDKVITELNTKINKYEKELIKCQN